MTLGGGRRSERTWRVSIVLYYITGGHSKDIFEASGWRSELCLQSSELWSESRALVSEARLSFTARLSAELAVYVAKVDKWW